MEYREEKQVSKEYKARFLSGIDYVIKSREKQAKCIRNKYAGNIFKTPGKYREDLKTMLGWPLVGCERSGAPKMEAEMLSQEDGYCIYRMQFEILEGLKMTGLFFKLDGEKKPLVIVQHGGQGTPELISGILYDSTANYNNMLHRVIKQGVHAFCPQILSWGHDDKDIEYDRKAIDARLKRVGSSIAAIEIYGIIRILDYFENQKYVSSFGMVGLSYGGFFTLYTSAIDTRIKSAISCSFFNTRDNYGWPDWVWYNSAEKFDDAEIACLVYPRKLCIQIGNRDDVFDYQYGLESFERIKEMCADVGTDWIEMIVFDGTHEFCTDDEPIRKLVADIKK